MEGQGYLAAATGTLGGAAVGGGVPAGILALTLECDPDTGFECLGVGITIIGSAILGALVGGLVGCYLALRWRGHVARGATCLFLVLVLFVAANVLGLVTAAVDGLASRVAGPINGVLAIGTAVGSPLAARRLALAWHRRRRARPVEI